MFPKNPSFIHYKELFTETDFPLWYMNTLKIATMNMVFSIIIITITSYIFSRFRFKGRKQGLMAMLILQMFPTFLAMTALYVLLWQMKLIDKHIGLVLVYVGGAIPYNTWLVKGYFDGIPRSLDEAARIDGATNLTVFRKITMPLAKPIITFVAVGLFEWVKGQQNTKFTIFAAGAILVAIPIVALFAYLQKNIVEGLSSGASKG
jgi:arabinogalactan oligomer/maltooligosaccharide transport system permease protein